MIESAPAVVVMHGWGGNAALMLPLARPLHEAGYATLFVDARCPLPRLFGRRRGLPVLDDVVVDRCRHRRRRRIRLHGGPTAGAREQRSGEQRSD